MNAMASWGLALLALVAGWIGWGWRGLVLALTVIVFWMLLQFNRALRAMQAAAHQPKGHVDSAVMLNARLQRGMRLAQVMQLTRSFGLPASGADAQAAADPSPAPPAAPDEEVFVWCDPGGDQVRVRLRAGKVTDWVLQRGS